MRIHTCKQGSREWWALRLGIPTASKLHLIITDTTFAYREEGARAYMAELIAEKILGKPADESEVSTIWQDYGSGEGEAQARRWYEAYRERSVVQVGFVDTDIGGARFGCSPDGLIDDDGGVEIKRRKSRNHMKAVLGLDPIASMWQVQGGLWVTRRDWWDVVAFNEKLPKRIERVRRIPKAQTAITDHLDRFFEQMAEVEEQLKGYGDVIEPDSDLLHKLRLSVAEAAK